MDKDHGRMAVFLHWILFGIMCRWHVERRFVSCSYSYVVYDIVGGIICIILNIENRPKLREQMLDHSCRSTTL